jgi:hypothetical protein
VKEAIYAYIYVCVFKMIVKIHLCIINTRCNDEMIDVMKIETLKIIKEKK